MGHDKMAGRNFRKGPSDEEKGIGDEEKGIGNVGGRKREVYSVSFMLSRSVRPVNAKPQVDVVESVASGCPYPGVSCSQEKTFAVL